MSQSSPRFQFGSHLAARIGRGLVHFVPASYDEATAAYTGTKFTAADPEGHEAVVHERIIAGPWSDDIDTRRALTAEFDAKRKAAKAAA